MVCCINFWLTPHFNCNIYLPINASYNLFPTDQLKLPRVRCLGYFVTFTYNFLIFCASSGILQPPVIKQTSTPRGCQ